MANAPIKPIDCLLPMIGVMAGFGLGIAFVLLLPDEWKTGFNAMWFPRWMGLVAALTLWAMFTIRRGKSLHCGGTLPISENDKTKYYVGGILVFIGYTGMAFAYANAQAEILVFLIFIFLAIFLSEVGWGNPFHAFNAFSRRKS